jgi:hypothetical protein
VSLRTSGWANSFVSEVGERRSPQSQSASQRLRAADKVVCAAFTGAGLDEHLEAAGIDRLGFGVDRVPRRPGLDHLLHRAVREDPSEVRPCAFFNPAGHLVEENFETLTRIIEGYEAEQERQCAAVPHCRTDGGARAAYVDELENFTSDWNHLNVRGSARAAEIVWPAVVALLELS